MSKLFKKYKTLLEESNCLTERQIISLKSRISTTPFSLTEDEIQELRDQLSYDNCEFFIENDHSEKGINYLKTKCLKLNGKPRKTKQLINMPSKFFYAINNFSYFTFVGFTEIDNGYSYYTFYMPVWRIHTKCGAYFDYYMDFGLVFNWIDHNINYNLKLVKGA